MADKPSTADIIRMIRESGDGGSSEPAAEPVVADEPQAASAPAEAPAPVKPAATGGSPLDMIRGAAAASAPASPPATGGSPMDMIRAAKGGGAATPAPAKPAASGGSPLDMIRGGAGAAAASPAAGSASKAAPKKAAKIPAGDLPPVSEMLAQMKAGKKPAAESEAVPAKPAKPAKPELKIPARPSKAAGKRKDTRRSFVLGMILSPFAMAWSILTVMTGVWTLALARFMFPNVLVEPPSQFKIGPPSDYPLGSVSIKWTAKRGIWVVHTDEYKGQSLIYALASVCTHLGCTPSWLEGEQKFKCPCHGSGFYITGVNFEGPAPRPLERVGLRLAPDGALEVDKSVKVQEEYGQWEDGKSFVDASLV